MILHVIERFFVDRHESGAVAETIGNLILFDLLILFVFRISATVNLDFRRWITSIDFFQSKDGRFIIFDLSMTENPLCIDEKHRSYLDVSADV